MNTSVKSESNSFEFDGWGFSPLPLLPESLRAYWADEHLPSWYATDMKLPETATYKDLDSKVWLRIDRLPHRCRALLFRRLNGASVEIAKLPAIPREWPDTLDPADVPWPPRVWNAVLRGRMLSRLPKLSMISFGELFSIPSFGPKGILQFTCILEGVLTAIGRSPSRANPLDSDMVAQSTSDDLRDEILKILDLPWAGSVSRHDGRFRDLIPPELGDKTLLEHIEEGSPDSIDFDFMDFDFVQDRPRLRSQHYGRRSTLSNEILLEALPAISARIDEIEKLQLEETLEDFFQKSNPRMRRFQEVFHALRDRFGWGDVAGLILEEVGRNLGVTRERARQLEKKLCESIPDHEIWMPALDRALRALEAYAPISASRASSRLVKDGICARAFTPQGVLKAADLFSLQHTVSLVEEGDNFLVISIGSSRDIPLINQIAKKQANASGASTVLELDAELRSHDVEMDIEELRETVRSLPDMTFVQGDWFVYLDGRNSMKVSIARKMLSVTAPLTAKTIRAGLHRQIRFRKTRGKSDWPLILAPTAVIQHILENNESFVSDPDSGFRLSSPIDYNEVLRGTEAAIVSILRSSPSGVWERSDILEEAERRGLNIATVSVYLTYSPVIGHLGVDLWTVCGAHVAPEAVEALRKAKSQRSRTKRTLGHTWTQEGNLAIAYRIPHNWHPSNVLGIPSDVTRFLTHEEYPAFTKSGAPVGKLRLYPNANNLVFGGYSKFLNNVSAEAGDVLIVEFKTLEGSAELRLESPEVFDSVEFSG